MPAPYPWPLPSQKLLVQEVCAPSPTGSRAGLSLSNCIFTESVITIFPKMTNELRARASAHGEPEENVNE